MSASSNEGVKLLEPDGGHDPIWTARVLDAVDSAGPMGTVIRCRVPRRCRRLDATCDQAG